MRVHLRNVVESALERGVVKGHHRITKLPKKKQDDFDVVVDTMMKSIWESLDGIIDFTDDDEDSKDGPSGKDRAGIGFHTTDAVSTDSIVPEDDGENDDDDDDIVPLDVLYRVHTRR